MKAILKQDHNLLYKLSRKEALLKGLPSRTYIISSPSARKIHFSPALVSNELFVESQKCSEVFLRFIQKLGLLRNCRFSEIYELILFTGGLYYFLSSAFANVFGNSLATGFIGVKRYFRNGLPEAKISYDNFEGTPESGVTIIGDTIGTGATIYTSIKYYLRKLVEARKKVETVLVFSIAGALPGAQALGKLEKEIKKEYGTSLHVFFCEAIFGLEDNNIDMKYLRKDTIAPEASLKFAREQFGIFFGTHLCSIWDWGERNKTPLKHLREVIRVATSLKVKAGSKRDLQALEKLIKEADNKLDEQEKVIV